MLSITYFCSEASSSASDSSKYASLSARGQRRAAQGGPLGPPGSNGELLEVVGTPQIQRQCASKSLSRKHRGLGFEETFEGVTEQMQQEEEDSGIRSLISDR